MRIKYIIILILFFGCKAKDHCEFYSFSYENGANSQKYGQIMWINEQWVPSGKKMTCENCAAYMQAEIERLRKIKDTTFVYPGPPPNRIEKNFKTLCHCEYIGVR